MKFLLASLKKHILIQKIVPKAKSNFRFGFPLLSLVTSAHSWTVFGKIFWITGGLRNDF
jgi:hypothetical protein